MDEFTLSLALFNFFPVVFTALGMTFLVLWLHEGCPDNTPFAVVAAVLVVLGGLTKASWKLIFTLSGTDLLWLGNALFPLIGPGFFMLAILTLATLCRQQGRTLTQRPWWPALLFIAMMLVLAAWRTWGLEITRGWFVPMMLLTTLGNLGLSALLIALSVRYRRWWLMGLLIINVLMIFLLQPIAMAEPKTVMLHWIEQTLTAFGTLCFTVAIYCLWQLRCGYTPVR